VYSFPAGWVFASGPGACLQAAQGSEEAYPGPPCPWDPAPGWAAPVLGPGCSSPHCTAARQPRGDDDGGGGDGSPVRGLTRLRGPDLETVEGVLLPP